MTVRPANPADADEWLRLRRALWPEESSMDLAREVEEFRSGRRRHLREVLVAEADNGALVGFAELGLRDYAEGCSTEKVAYLEGWYVEPEYRRQGVGAALVAAAERWAAAKGCTEFASDALADNDTSRAAHLALGFDEVVVIRCFRKSLGS